MGSFSSLLIAFMRVDLVLLRQMGASRYPLHGSAKITECHQSANDPRLAWQVVPEVPSRGDYRSVAHTPLETARG
jgi:hypothetical protein